MGEWQDCDSISFCEEQSAELSSAIECLRDIAAMGKKAGSETARNWLIANGHAREEGGYVPGKGFEEPR